MPGGGNPIQLPLALLKPWGITLFAASSALALGAQLGIPWTGRWQGREPWLVLSGLFAYLAFVVVSRAGASARAAYSMTTGSIPAPESADLSASGMQDLRAPVEDALKHLNNAG